LSPPKAPLLKKRTIFEEVADVSSLHAFKRSISFDCSTLSYPKFFDRKLLDREDDLSQLEEELLEENEEIVLKTSNL
jgi:hypothetical protein